MADRRLNDPETEPRTAEPREFIEDDGVPIGVLPSGELLVVSPEEAALGIPIDEDVPLLEDYDPGELRDPQGRWRRGGGGGLSEAETLEMSRTERELLEKIRKKKAAEQLGEAFVGLRGGPDYPSSRGRRR